ncbi:MAG: hypothetical protein CFH10_00783 [Alphaproteobacteria bacterium MarineAlpha4_Bin2]|nr:MAG: hypothetical protein CFH10_00783 [Alphaproteobacteria bacterium MarineAlpha4_Bin2]
MGSHEYNRGDDSDYHDMLGYRITEWRDGYVRLEMDVLPHHRHRGSHTHGGILMGLLDISGLLSNLYDKHDRVETLTQSLSTNFIAAVHSQKLAAIGELIKAGNSVYFANSKIIDIETDTLLANGQGTFRIRPKDHGKRSGREEL